MPSKLGHLVKLVPVAIGGTYSAYPSFLPTQPKDIKGLLTDRKCYIVAQSKKESGGSSSNKAKYLFACITDPVGKTLDFFYFDSSKRVAIPVKHLKVSRLGGASNEEKQINLGFTWGGIFTLVTESFTFNSPFSVRGEEEMIYPSSFCKETVITQFSGKEFLKCTWSEMGEDYWRRVIGKKQKEEQSKKKE